jgi:hypothetical protein
MIEIREAQIENILVNAPILTKSILHLEEDPRLIARQMALPSGRLDMLYAYRSSFLLLELKIEACQNRFIEQVLGYYNDLRSFQDSGRLLRGEIQPILLCPHFNSSVQKSAEKERITCIQYNPEFVLNYFYQNLRPVASFVEIKPIDIGIWNLHLIHKFIYGVEFTNSVKKLQRDLEGSPRTLYNKIKFASELRLIDWKPNSDYIALTALGKEYIQAKDNFLEERLSEPQAVLLRKLVMQNPYESSVVIGIASIVEATFALSKNTYPVQMEQLIEYFTLHSGKIFDWKTDKARYNATRMYSNYAVDLGLLAKTDKAVYITPEGYRFTIQMQLHKSLKLMETLSIR